MNINKKVVIVTGASKGIGAAIAKRMCEHGYYVIGTSTSGRGDNQGVNKWLKADFSDMNSLKEFLVILKDLDRIDALVNNAGINIIRPQQEVIFEDFIKIQNINLCAPYFISSVAAQKMSTTGGGRIVNIASIWSIVSKKHRTLYSTMKSGLHGLTRAMAIEWADQNILVNSVSPGFINTELTKKSLTGEEAGQLAQLIPLKRFGETIEIAELISFLSGDSNSYITGQNIVIDGGFTGV
jgi:3-oxoacyl-[acyl-carrier protein] reductase